MPLVPIAVIHRELVVEVVVTFAHGDECRKWVISWCMLVIVWFLSYPMAQRIDAKSGLESCQSPSRICLRG